MANQQRELTLTGLAIALVTITTMVVHIPIPATQGFVNIGDTIIFTTAILFGRRMGFWAGGLGSALADLLLGYPQWAPWTLLIKGLEGWIVGTLGYSTVKKSPGHLGLAMLPGTLWMVLGYYLVGGFIYGFKVAWIEIPGNLFQGSISILLAGLLIYSLQKIGSRHQGLPWRE